VSKIAYKLFRVRKDGSLGPPFINARQRIPLRELLIGASNRRYYVCFKVDENFKAQWCGGVKDGRASRFGGAGDEDDQEHKAR
jgi:hypothetical protein